MQRALERCDLGCRKLLRLRQTLKDLRAGGHVLTMLPTSGPQSFLKGGPGGASPCPPQDVIFLFKVRCGHRFKGPRPSTDFATH